MREHPPYLLFEDGGLLETPLLRHLQERVVRRAAPQEERKARREIEIADAIRLSRRKGGRLLLDAIDELRRGQNAGKRSLDTELEILLAPSLPIELHQRIDNRRRHRPPERAGRDVLNDAARARLFLSRLGRRADEQPPPTRGAGRMRRGEGAFDADRADVGKERVAGRRPGLDRRPAKVLAE